MFFKFWRICSLVSLGGSFSCVGGIVKFLIIVLIFFCLCLVDFLICLIELWVWCIRNVELICEELLVGIVSLVFINFVCMNVVFGNFYFN